MSQLIFFCFSFAPFRMYKNAGLLKKKRRPISLVVNSKAGSKAPKQQAAKGAKIKLVDKRMKSDLRGQAKAAARKQGGGKGRGRGFGGRGRGGGRGGRGGRR